MYKTTTSNIKKECVITQILRVSMKTSAYQDAAVVVKLGIVVASAPQWVVVSATTEIKRLRLVECSRSKNSYKG